MPLRLLPVLLFFCLFFQTITFAANPSKVLVPATIDKHLQTQVEKEVDNVSVFTLNQSELQKLFSKKQKSILLEIPIANGKTETLILTKAQVSAEGFQIRTSGNNIYTESFEKAIHYRGTVENKRGSVAAISFTSKEISGVFATGSGNYNLVKLKTKSKEKQDLYAVFNDVDILKKNPFQCHSGELEQVIHQKDQINKLKGGGNPHVQADNCRRVTIFFECDYKMYQDNGSSVPNTVNWLAGMFNVVATLYANEEIKIQISEVLVHNKPDFWPEESSHENLYAFADTLDTRPAFNGNLAHLLSTKNLSLGGVAWLDVLCGSSSNHAYSNIYNDYAQLPFYSWTVNVVAHEMGHNFGSPHTQSCNWETSPGVFGMLDSCYTPEGDCYEGPAIPIMGTIMSYCHLVAGIDLTKGFGPLPGELIRDNFNTAFCLDGSVVFSGVAVSKPDTLCEGSTLNLTATLIAGASYLWTGPNNFSSTLRNPSIPNISSIHAGTYTLVITNNECTSFPFTTKLMVNCIAIDPVADISLCQQSGFDVGFTASFTPGTGNMYTAEISNATGSFASPTAIGILNSTASKGSIPVKIPPTFPLGTGYLIRVKSSNPAKTGLSNGIPLSVLTQPTAPSVADQTRCSSGVLTFNGTGNSIYRWYADSQATGSLFTGPNFTTPILNTDKSYFVSSQAQTKASVGPVDPLFTGDGGQLTNFNQGLFIRVLKDLRIDSVTVYPDGVGNIAFRVRDSANTRTFANISNPVDGHVTGEKIAINITLTPGLYRVDAVGSNATSMYRTNGTIGYPFTSAGIMSIVNATAEGRYYFFYNWKVTGLDCQSQKKKVWARITGTPNAPTVTQNQKCGPGSVQLSASGASAGSSYRWYTLSSGGNPITGETSSAFNTPTINQTTTYYASIVNASNCESVRAPVTATINEVPDPPFVTSNPPAACTGDSVLLTATGGIQVFNFSWFDANKNLIPGFTLNTLQTPALLSNVKYYVSRSNLTCESLKDSVTVVVNPRPGAPTTFTHTRCGSGSVTLKASGSTGAVIFQWFTSLSGGTAIAGAFDSLYTTPVINTGSDTFYVTPVNGFGCPAQIRKASIAQIIDRPAAPLASDSSRCGPGIVNLKAGNALAGEVYRWYPTVNSPLADSIPNTTNGVFTTPLLNQTTSYFVVKSKPDNCESFPRTEVKAVILSEPAVPVLTLSGGFLVVSFDSTFKWFKDGLQQFFFSDSLPLSTYGPGTYYVTITRANGCSAQSNSVVVTGVSDFENQNNLVTVFPNPGDGLFQLKSEKAISADLSLYDMQGKQVWKDQITSTETQLDIRSLASGIYTLKVQTKENVQVIRLRKN